MVDLDRKKAPSMEAILSKLIDQLNSSVFVLLGILAVAAWALYHFGRWKEKFFTHDQRLDKVDSIHESVIELKTKVQLIYDNTNPRATLRSSSPISLTDIGNEIAAKIGTEAIFSRYLAALVGKANAKCPVGANAYDIQTISMDIAKKDLPGMANANEINLVKDEAFDRGLLAEDIWAIFGVYLRDHILRDRGIAVAEVDKHSLGKK